MELVDFFINLTFDTLLVIRLVHSMTPVLLCHKGPARNVTGGDKSLLIGAFLAFSFAKGHLEWICISTFLASYPDIWWTSLLVIVIDLQLDLSSLSKCKLILCLTFCHFILRKCPTVFPLRVHWIT